MHKFNFKNIEKLDNPERRKMMPPEETLLKFDVRDDGDLLDIGCGIGYFTVPAAKLIKNFKVIGIDILQEMLDVAKEKAVGIENVEFIRSEEYYFPVETHSMKYVFICNVIHEVKDKTMYFNEINRVLRDDGFILIIDWEKKDMKMGPHLQERIFKDEMINLGMQFGFKLSKDVNISENYYGLKFEKIR